MYKCKQGEGLMACGGSCLHVKEVCCVRLDFTFLSKSSLIPEAAHDFRLPLLNIQEIINHVRSSGSAWSSYVNANMREEVPSVPRSARHLNDDKCATHSGNIESYRDIYQVTFEQDER